MQFHDFLPVTCNITQLSLISSNRIKSIFRKSLTSTCHCMWPRLTKVTIFWFAINRSNDSDEYSFHVYRLVQWHNYFGLTSGHRCFYMQIVSGSFDLVTKITKTHKWLVVVTLIPANRTKYYNATYIATQMCSNTCVIIKTFIWISLTFNMPGVISEAIELIVLVAYCAPYVYVMINMLADAREHPFTRIMTLCCCKNTVLMKSSSTN